MARSRTALQRLATYLLLAAAASLGAIGLFLVANDSPVSEIVGKASLLAAAFALAAAAASWSSYVRLRMLTAVVVFLFGLWLGLYAAVPLPGWLRGEYADFWVAPEETLQIVGGLVAATLAIVAAAALVTDRMRAPLAPFRH